jgi:phosphatidylserine decarboxylase
VPSSPESLPKEPAQTSLIRRFASKLRLAAEGLLIVLPVVAAGLCLATGGCVASGVVVVAIGAAIAAFFRDPNRSVSAGADAVLSAADGRICNIAPASLPGIDEDQLYTRISVFMSPLDVHVNRASVSGEVTALKHVKVEFRAAFRDTASEHNEHTLVRIKDEHGRDHALVQIAGYIARRIVSYLQPHQRLQRGQRIGLIMFGSRVDHFLPRDYRVAVEVGDRVRAGETIIGEPQNERHRVEQ